MNGEPEAFRWRSAGASHVGTVRKINEDAYLDWPEIGLWMVADGMGGHDAGDVASRMIVDSFGDLPVPRSRDSFLEAILLRLQAVNADLRSYAAEHGMSIVGSTVALLFGYGSWFTCLWAGDSRIYQLRQGRLRQLTRDHSQIEEMANLGLLDKNQPEARSIGNVITRAAGAAESLAVDTITHKFQHGDCYLLCSDGLSNTVPDTEIAAILAENDCENSPRALLYRALDHNARDNVTAVVVHIEADRRW